MKPSNENIDRSSRWLLYHGTSIRRLNKVLKENRLRVSPTGPAKIALTPEWSVAEYFACNAEVGDWLNDRTSISEPVVLALDGEKLLRRGYLLRGHSDPVWGNGECDWENEIACWNDIDAVDGVLLWQELVSEERWKAYYTGKTRERRRRRFMPSGLRLAEYELDIVSDMMRRRRNGSLKKAQADAIKASLNQLREAVRSPGLEVAQLRCAA